jgi:uncharacterized repeat protein (TIGR01451 family)/LPXTG-motif cell wall-anchored protein
LYEDIDNDAQSDGDVNRPLRGVTPGYTLAPAAAAADGAGGTVTREGTAAGTPKLALTHAGGYALYQGLPVEHNDLGLIYPPTNWISGLVWADRGGVSGLGDGIRQDDETPAAGSEVEVWLYRSADGGDTWALEKEFQLGRATLDGDGQYKFRVFPLVPDGNNPGGYTDTVYQYILVFDRPARYLASPYTYDPNRADPGGFERDNDAGWPADPADYPLTPAEENLMDFLALNTWTRAATRPFQLATQDLGSQQGQEHWEIRDAAHMDAGIYMPPTAQLKGGIWEDKDKDGIQDGQAKEPGVAGVAVTLYVYGPGPAADAGDPWGWHPVKRPGAAPGDAYSRGEGTWLTAADGDEVYTVRTDGDGAYAFQADPADFGVTVTWGYDGSGADAARIVTGVEPSEHIYEVARYRVMVEKDRGYQFSPYKEKVSGLFGWLANSDELDSDFLSGEQFAGSGGAYEAPGLVGAVPPGVQSPALPAVPAVADRLRDPDIAFSFEDHSLAQTKGDGDPTIDFTTVLPEIRLDGGLIPSLSRIAGIVWDDTKNRDDLLRITGGWLGALFGWLLDRDEPIEDAPVALYRWSESDGLWRPAMGRDGQAMTTITDSRGRYEFLAPGAVWEKGDADYGQASQYRAVFSLAGGKASYVARDAGGEASRDMNSHARWWNDLTPAEQAEFALPRPRSGQAATEALVGTKLVYNDFYGVQLPEVTGPGEYQAEYDNIHGGMYGTASPNLALAKTADRPEVRPGDTLTYTLTVSNLERDGAAAGATRTARNAVIYDEIPAYTSLLPGTVKTWLASPDPENPDDPEGFTTVEDSPRVETVYLGEMVAPPGGGQPVPVISGIWWRVAELRVGETLTVRFQATVSASIPSSAYTVGADGKYRLEIKNLALLAEFGDTPVPGDPGRPPENPGDPGGPENPIDPNKPDPNDPDPNDPDKPVGPPLTPGQPITPGGPPPTEAETNTDALKPDDGGDGDDDDDDPDEPEIIEPKPPEPPEIITPETPDGPELPIIPLPPNIPGTTNVPTDDPYLYIVVDEDGVPIGEWRWEPEEEIWIYEEYPPLGNLPQTGDTLWLAGLAFALSGGGLTALTWRRRRRERKK